MFFYTDPPPAYGNYGNYQPQPPYQQPGYQQPGSYPSNPQSNSGYPNQGGGGYPQANPGYPPQGGQGGYPQSTPYPSAQPGNPGYPSGGYAPPTNMYPQVPNAAPYGNPAPSCESFFVCTSFFL